MTLNVYDLGLLRLDGINGWAELCMSPHQWSEGKGGGLWAGGYLTRKMLSLYFLLLLAPPEPSTPNSFIPYLWAGRAFENVSVGVRNQSVPLSAVQMRPVFCCG